MLSTLFDRAIVHLIAITKDGNLDPSAFQISVPTAVLFSPAVGIIVKMIMPIQMTLGNLNIKL